MAYHLNEINDRARRDPKDFLRECDDIYEKKLHTAAQRILEHGEVSPLIFLSGPSGSGKTTTAMKIEEILDRSGQETHTVALDHYFRSVRSGDYPLTPDGQPDLESPDCLDMELLNEHFHALEQGKTIEVPKYDFKTQKQTRNTGNFLNYRPGDLVIFEGIHALNDTFSALAPDAFKLYISARSNVEQDGKLLFNLDAPLPPGHPGLSVPGHFPGGDLADVGKRPPGREEIHFALQGKGGPHVRLLSHVRGIGDEIVCRYPVPGHPGRDRPLRGACQHRPRPQ